MRFGKIIPVGRDRLLGPGPHWVLPYPIYEVVKIPVGQKPPETEDFGFDRVIIYRFDEPDIIITPLAFVQGNLIFSTPDWNKGKPLQEISEGKIRKTLLKAYTNAQTPANP